MITNFRRHHAFILDLHDMQDNNNDNEEMHDQRLRAWYQGATRTKLRSQWINVDYTNIDSSDDEDTMYNQSNRVGRQVKTAPILDRVVLVQTWHIFLN
jgi:hypothetical protein